MCYDCYNQYCQCIKTYKLKKINDCECYKKKYKCYKLKCACCEKKHNFKKKYSYIEPDIYECYEPCILKSKPICDLLKSNNGSWDVVYYKLKYILDN